MEKPSLNLGGIITLIVTLITALSVLGSSADPRQYWFLSFLGLTFPFLFLVNIILVIFWGLLKNYRVIIPLACLLLSAYDIGMVWQLRLKPKMEAPIQLTSFNAHHFRESAPNRTRIPLDSILPIVVPNQAPRIVCFQEFTSIESVQNNTYSILSREAGLIHKLTFPGKGLAIFSNLPMQSTDHLFFNRDNGILMADFKVNDITYRVLNVHLKSNQLSDLLPQLADNNDPSQKETYKSVSNILTRFRNAVKVRADQVDQLIEIIKDSPYPIILCGDLNDVPFSYTYDQLNKYLIDPFRSSGSGYGFTYKGTIPGLRIDYFLTSPEIQPHFYLRGRRNYSDHIPIYMGIQ